MRPVFVLFLTVLSACGTDATDKDASDVCTGDVWLREAADVEEAAACTHIGGDLIVSAPDLVDFTGLEGLESIDGELRIGSDEALDLASVPAGTAIEVGPGRLESMRGLSGLQTIGGGLRIADSPAVEDSADCMRLYEDGISVLAGARSLTTLDGLDALTEIGGGVDGPSAYAGCAPLATALPALDASALDGVRVGGLGLAVAELPAVIVAPGSDVWIGRTTTSLGGASWPENLGRFVAEFDPSLDQTSLRAVTRIDELELYLPRGAGTAGFGGVTSAGDLRVVAAEATGPFLSGLSALETVDGDLYLDSVFCLTELTGLERLTSVGGTLTLYKTGVASLAPLANLTHVGAFAAAENPLLDPREIEAFAERLGVACGCAAPVPECRCEENGGSMTIDGCY